MADEKPEPADGDDGFTHESASVSFTPPPLDTTVGAGTPEPEPVEAAPPEPVSDEEPPIVEEPPPAAATASLAAATPGAKPKKKGPTLTERTTQLKRDVDALTYSKHQAQRELDALTAQLAARRAELPEAPPVAAAKPARPAATADAPADPGPMPQPPKYRDFATDEEFDAATVKWQTDVAAWQTARDTALEQRITGGLDSRLTAAEVQAAARRADAALAERITAAQAKHPDWAAKTAALRDLRSAWYDPAVHGPGSSTPFLSDLVQNHDADGAELLPWLGSDLARAQVLADLRPTRPLRDALVYAPSILPLLEYFATPDGVQAFEGLKGMHPLRMTHALGALSARLMAASRGPAPAAHVMTKAVPPAKPPGGTLGAQGAGTPPANQSFDDWMAAEDRRELAERKRLAGISG